MGKNQISGEKKGGGGGEDCKKNEFWKAVREEFFSQ